MTLEGRARLLGPVRPPKVSVLILEEKARVPVPVVSNVLFCRAELLPNWSVPALIIVFPL